MADILRMPPRTTRKGRPRNRPVEGAPLAEVKVVDFREANKPTYAEIQAYINTLAYHLLMAGRTLREISRAY